MLQTRETRHGTVPSRMRGSATTKPLLRPSKSRRLLCLAVLPNISCILSLLCRSLVTFSSILAGSGHANVIYLIFGRVHTSRCGPDNEAPSNSAMDRNNTYANTHILRHISRHILRPLVGNGLRIARGMPVLRCRFFAAGSSRACRWPRGSRGGCLQACVHLGYGAAATHGPRSTYLCTN